MKILFIPSPPAFYYLFPLRPKYLFSTLFSKTSTHVSPSRWKTIKKKNRKIKNSVPFQCFFVGGEGVITQNVAVMHTTKINIRKIKIVFHEFLIATPVGGQ